MSVKIATDGGVKGTGIVSITASVTAAADKNAGLGITNLLNVAGGCTVTLPAATGTGNHYRFVVQTVSTTGYVIQVTTDDTMNGLVLFLDNDGTAVTGYAAIGGDDTYTFNGTTKGGQIGDWIEFQDIATDVWHVRGQVVVPAGSNPADPFTAAVT